MNKVRIFARKNAIRVMTQEEIEASSGGLTIYNNNYNYGQLPTGMGGNSNPTNCAGPAGNPGDYEAGIVYYIEDDCGRDQ